MKPNLGRTDRIIRLVLGILAFAVGILNYFEDGLLNVLCLATGILLLSTALIGVCPIYRFLGIKTVRSGKIVY